MAETRAQTTKLRNVPIAVTPEGFWCCPSPAVFQKTLKAQTPPARPKPNPQAPQKQNPPADEQEQQKAHGNNPDPQPQAQERPSGRQQKPENAPKKVAIEFGEPGTSDLKVTLVGYKGLTVKLSVHRRVLSEFSSFFASRISADQPVFPCMEIEDCEDVEIYVETIGLMYCNDLKQRLMKQSVLRVLRILKAGEQLGYSACVRSCLEYLEAVPWVGEEEEERVVSLVRSIRGEGVSVKPVLKRVSSNVPKPPKDTISHILELVLRSKDEKGRREMKSTVLKLLRENNSSLPASSSDLCNQTLYDSCRASLDSLLSLFRQASDPTDIGEPVSKSIGLEADNLLWLIDILVDRQAADEFALIWANEGELVNLHSGLPIATRFHVSVISSRLFVGIGRGEILPCKDTRCLLLMTWLGPLIGDYGWLQHGVRSFDRTVVEEGIGRTVLTLPLDDQRAIMMTWLGSFLKTGDGNCPNLGRAFEVWWRRTFVRPYGEPGIVGGTDGG